MLARLFKRNTPTPYTRTTKKVLILGKLYSFKISEGKRNSCKIEGDIINVTLYPATKDNFQRYIDGWYTRLARKRYYEAVDKWAPEFKRLDYEIPYPRLKIYQMYKAWGRCYYMKDVITINSKLIRMPDECVDYILLHEMTHFVAHDHGMLFRAIMDKIDPDWRKKEGLLRNLEQQKVLMQ